MNEAEILEGLKQAVLDYDAEAGTRLVRQGLDQGIPPLQLIDGGLSRGIAVIGEKFQTMEIFLPELLMAAKVFLEAMKILEPVILAAGGGRQKRGVAVIGTVKGDVHSIGKDLFGTLLKVAGFEVHNLGVNVHPGKFIEKVEETGAEIVGLSALMTTTMPSMREVIEFFEARIEQLQDEVAERHGFVLLSHTHQMRGICRSCRPRRPKSSAGSSGEERLTSGALPFTSRPRG